MKPRIAIMTALLLAACLNARGQDNPVLPEQPRHISLLDDETRLLFSWPGEMRILAFRKYEIERMFEAADPAPLFTSPAFQQQERSISDIYTINDRPSVSLPLSKEALSLPYSGGLGRFALQEALRLGYQFFRESTRKSSLTDFDYLELPRGTGMFRTFRDVSNEALLRGELQSLETHEELRRREKRSPAPDP
jgi:hypothetical protein